MEQLRERGKKQEDELRDRQDRPLVWLGHDDLPEVGRWLYVVSRQAWDQGFDHGAWVSGDLDGELAALAVCQALGDPGARRDLVVVDQVGFEDGKMVDENHLVGPEARR